VRANGYRFDGSAHPTLARVLDARLRHGAAVSSYVLRAATGINDSSDFFDDSVGGTWVDADVSLLQRPGGETARRAVAWAESVKARPFFLSCTSTSRTTHEPPEPFRSRYGVTYDGEVAATDVVVGEFLG
jgi:hypothetical protein